MSNKRIDMINLKQLIQLKHNQYSNRKISELLGINRKTVDSYIHFFSSIGKPIEELLDYSEEQLTSLFPAKHVQYNDQAYNNLEALFPQIEKDLKAPGATVLEIWKQYKSHHKDGYGYTQFKKYLQKWQQGQQPLSMLLSHSMGDKLFIDYAGKKLEIVDKETGEVKPAEVFVAVLGGSQYTFVEASYTQKQEDFLKSIRNSLEYFGGVPKAIVPDNLKQAVDKSHKYEPTINKQLRAFALHYNTAIFPTRTYRPQDKALVERSVNLVYQRVYFHLRNQVFFCLEDLNKAIKELLKQYNDYFFQQRDYSRKTLFEQQEKPLLQPLPQNRFQMYNFSKATVQKTYHVYFGPDKHLYSVPCKYAGKDVVLQYTDTVVEVYYNGERIALHVRNRSKPGGYTTTKEHMPLNHQFVSNWSVEEFVRWGNSKHERIGVFIERLFELQSYPMLGFRSCMGIKSLHKQYGTQRLADACKRAMEFKAFSYTVLNNILKKGLDQQKELDFSNSPVPPPKHSNIRGKDTYQ
jgi:transposase/biotin operon repressor